MPHVFAKTLPEARRKTASSLSPFLTVSLVEGARTSLAELALSSSTGVEPASTVSPSGRASPGERRSPTARERLRVDGRRLRQLRGDRGGRVGERGRLFGALIGDVGGRSVGRQDHA